MFTFWNSKLNIACRRDIRYESRESVELRRVPTFLIATLVGASLLAGCQQQPETEPSGSDQQTSTQTDVKDTKPAPLSDSAEARIKQFQPIYVTQMQGLQRRLQAEYEALQAADASDSDTVLLPNNESEPTADSTDMNLTDSTDGATANPINKGTDVEYANEVATNNAETEINTSTKVGERDLEVLKRISLEPRSPKILSEQQLVERYQHAMQALYEPATTALNTQDIDTLLNIATLIPKLFEHTEIAERVSIKSPALARLIIQHQVWEQIEAQQARDMQQMKITQQQEFEGLMRKFNDTITDYDKQIAKYEQTLKEFQ